METLMSTGCTDVGSINPVQDFQVTLAISLLLWQEINKSMLLKEMMARRDIDLVDKAIDQMKERILALVNDSIRDQLYPKALECLAALRKGCIQEEESHKYPVHSLTHSLTPSHSLSFTHSLSGSTTF